MLGTLAELAARHGGRVEGLGATAVRAVATLDDAGPGDLAVLTHARYARRASGSAAAAFLTDEALSRWVAGRPAWIHPSPRLALARLLASLPPPPWAAAGDGPGVHGSAIVDPRAELGEGVRLGPVAVVEARAVVGPGTVLGAHAVVGQAARIGACCVLGPGSMVLGGCVLGDRVRLGPGAVVGADGFGFVPGAEGEPPVAIPQRGHVVIEDDVELGALAVVDRATIGTTVVRRGTKIDNLVQVGHNCDVGPGVVIAAQSGLAGSVRVGAGALLGGQAGVADHLEVGPSARLAARAGVTGDVAAGETVAGYPALPHGEWLRIWGWLRRAAHRGRGAGG